MPPRTTQRSHIPDTASSSSSRGDPFSAPQELPYSSLHEALGGRRSAYQEDPARAADKSHPQSAQMSSDGRYLYQPPQGSQPMNSYDYPYPNSPHESTHFSQNPARPMRPSAGQPHSPHPQSTFQPAPSPYQTPYGSSGHYSVPQQPPQPQWTNEAWGQYGQPFASPAPVQDPSFASGPGRPEVVQNPPPEQRSYGPPQPVSTEPRRHARPTGSSPRPKSKQRNRDSSSQPTSRLPNASSGLDFLKLLESYQLVIDESQALASDTLPAQTRPPPAETMERMLQSAAFGLQMLEAAPVQSSLPEVPPVNDRSSAENTREPVSTPQKQRKDVPAQEGQVCLGCNATSTPEWRRGPMGPRTLCNACGLVYAKLIKKRSREAARARGAAKPSAQRGSGAQGLLDDPGLSSVEGGSDDDDSFGSHDRQSDIGEHGGGRE